MSAMKHEFTVSAQKPWRDTKAGSAERRGSYRKGENPELVEICLKCPRETCRPNDCKYLQNPREKFQIPPYFAVRLQAGWSRAKLARQYGVTVYRVRKWAEKLGK